MSKYQLCQLLWSSVNGLENIMGFVQVLFILSLVIFSCQEPFIFEENNFCSYPSSKKDEITETRSNTVSIKYEQLEIKYKLCGTFINNICPVGTVACLKNHETGKKVNLGTAFIVDNSYNFKSINGEMCSKSRNYSMVVHLQCSKPMKEEAPILIDKEKCTYHVNMTDPKCQLKEQTQTNPRCTTYIDRKFIDLGALDLSFSVSSAERNFSVTLCEKNPMCGGDVNACEVIGDRKTPISLASSISVSYIGQKNQLSFHGVTFKGKNNKIDKRFEVILKCNWDKKDIKNEDLDYVKKQTQGRKYTFELETSFGCIKMPISCIVYDQFLIYNLSGLYNEHQEMWSTNGDKENSESIYFLQVCGPVELAGKNTSCKSTYAQVCENRNGVDINRGSVLRHLEVINDLLKATIESGMQCKKNPDVQYRTFVDFECQEIEEGPKFSKQTDCDTYFTWKTPHACPQYNVSSCSHVHEHYHPCSFQHGDKFYNLTALTKTRKFIGDDNKEFLINVCGPVMDPDAPCMRDVSVALKNLTEFNPKYKILSLGKFSDTSVEDDSLILEYITGSFCDGTDYTSKIRFECSDLEEEPVIIKQEKCSYEFLWRTKYACPSTNKEKTPRNVVRNCSYIDRYNNKSIDFGHIEKHSIQLNDHNKYNYTFDICQRSYSNCTYNGDDCRYVPIERAVVESLHNSTILEFTLPIRCQRTDDFNKVTFILICEEVINNDHVMIMDIVNCSLMINLYTSFACSLKYDNVQVKRMEKPDMPVLPKVANLTQPKQELLKTTIECFTKSPFTNQELNITKLPLKNDFLKDKCPVVIYNDTYRYVKLLYVTTNQCRPIPAKNLSYEVYLKCTKDKIIPAANDVCLEYDNYEKLEFCNLFNPPIQYSTSTGLIIGLVIGFLLLIAFISIVLFLVMRRNNCKAKRQGFTSIYQKE